MKLCSNAKKTNFLTDLYFLNILSEHNIILLLNVYILKIKNIKKKIHSVSYLFTFYVGRKTAKHNSQSSYSAITKRITKYINFTDPSLSTYCLFGDIVFYFLHSYKFSKYSFKNWSTVLIANSRMHTFCKLTQSILLSTMLWKAFDSCRTFYTLNDNKMDNRIIPINQKCLLTAL